MFWHREVEVLAVKAPPLDLRTINAIQCKLLNNAGSHPIATVILDNWLAQVNDRNQRLRLRGEGRNSCKLSCVVDCGSLVSSQVAEILFEEVWCSET